MDFLTAALGSSWTLVTTSAPWLLVGFAVGGLLEALVPTAWIQGYLGGGRYRSVVRAAFIGAPLPLCSCSVLPTAVALRRGAPALARSPTAGPLSDAGEACRTPEPCPAAPSLVASAAGPTRVPISALVAAPRVVAS